jgi:Tol biopolymer transport system component
MGRASGSFATTPLQGLVTSAWTPAGDGIVLGHDVNSVQRLEVFDAAGKAPPRLLLEGAAVDWVVFRPPAGDELLIRARIEGRWGLYAMRPDGSAIRLLAASLGAPNANGRPDQDLNFPAYSPDGTRIYYNRYTPEARTVQAWVMNADGSDQHRFNRSGPSCCWWEGESMPSPDGRWVVMWRVSPSGTGAITRFPADGSGDGVRIGPYVAGTALWGWAPDSTGLLLNFNDASEGDQLLIDPATGEVHPPGWQADTMPDWQRIALP